MAVRNKKRGGSLADDAERSSSPVGDSASIVEPVGNATITSSSANAPAVPTTPPSSSSKDGNTSITDSAIPAALGSPIDLTSTQSEVPSTPKKRKLSDAASGPSTPPSVRSSKSDSPYRSRIGGVASVVKAIGTLTLRPTEPLSPGIRRWLPEHVIDRLNTAVGLCKSSAAFYSISMLPTVLTWGPGNGSSLPTDESRFIVQGSEIVKVLFIGEVTKTFLRGTSTNRGSCSLNVLPLFKAEAERLEDLVKGFATSSKVKVMTSDICNTGVMISAAIGVDAVFKSIYDGCGKYGKKSEMDKLVANDITPGDVVFVEAHIQRYVHFDDHNRPRDGFQWSAVPFRIGFQLKSISLIATPRDYVEDDDDVEF